MKNIITIITIALCSSIYAQPASVMNITYIDVPRTEADAFLASHVKFSNMSISEDRKSLHMAFLLMLLQIITLLLFMTFMHLQLMLKKIVIWQI